MPTINPITRRDFLISAGLTGVAFAINRRSLVNHIGANERVRAGVIGLGVRGLRHVTALTSLPNVEVAALCDVKESLVHTVTAGLTKSGWPQPGIFNDFRYLLESRNLDVISIAVPRAMRALVAIEACQAGKHVLIEQPCCDGISDGRALEKISSAKRRFVQQTASESLILSPELLMFLKTRDAGEIARVSALQQVFVGSGRGNIDGAHLDNTLENLDLARCLMGVRFPNHVSSIEPSGPISRAISRSSFVFENDNRQTQTIELTKLTSNSDSRNFQDNSHALLERDETTTFNLLRFHTSQGEFAVTFDPSRDIGRELQNSCLNLISAVRDQNAKALQNPISEARVSSSLLKLAEASVRFKRGFAFDPERECAIDDPEIDAFIQ